MFPISQTIKTKCLVYLICWTASVTTLSLEQPISEIASYHNESQRMDPLANYKSPFHFNHCFCNKAVFKSSSALVQVAPKKLSEYFYIPMLALNSCFFHIVFEIEHESSIYTCRVLDPHLRFIMYSSLCSIYAAVKRIFQKYFPHYYMRISFSTIYLVMPSHRFLQLHYICSDSILPQK